MAAERRFTKEMVLRTIKYFSDPASADQTDANAMKALLVDYVKFESIVERGLVTSDAKQLATDFVLYARGWIKQHHLEQTYRGLKK